MPSPPNVETPVSNVLLAVYTAGHFTELIRLVRLLQRSSRYTPILWFAKAYDEIERDIKTCQIENHPFVQDGTPIGSQDGSGTRPSGRSAAAASAWIAVRRALSALPFPFTVVRAVGRQRQQIVLARRIVAREKPAAVIVAEDTVGYETAALIKAAHERRVPSVIVPFTVANALEPAEMFFDHPAHNLRRLSNRLVGMLYPKWVYEYRGQKLLRMPGPQVVAKEWWGLAPALPWQMNSGSADALTVESVFMEAYYRREGLPPPPLVVTGAISDDTLAEHVDDAPARRAALCAELGLPSDRRLILCALPDDRLSLRGSQTEFADYSALVRFVVQTLAATPGSSVVIRLHPRASYEAHRYIEQWGVRISQRDTAALVPLCDIYVASVSATIRWAIACGKPVVNYDLYRLRLTDYADAPGVLRVEDRDEFAATLHRLAGDDAFFAEIRSRQQTDAARWGRLDGQAGARILKCIDKVIADAGGESPRHI